MERLNIALIGAGRRGAGAHLPVIAKMSEAFRLVAICDRDEATAQRYASEHRCKAYTSVVDLVANERLDIADVVVPADGHHAICCYLMEHGIHVLVETPIAITLPLADLMIETAQRNDVKLEIAENYYREPQERLKSLVIAQGHIGKVSRLHRIFREGGYHGMSVLRVRAGGNPTSVWSVTHTSDVVPHTDQMKRHHAQENWTLSVLTFENDVLAVMAYSNVIHARSMGRGQTGIWQVDGTKGTIVDDAVFLVPPDELEKGAIATAYTPQRTTEKVNGVEVLQALELGLPDGKLIWENPYRRFGVTEWQVSIADELWSIACAVWENGEPDYGAEAGRLDQEMNIGQHESALRDRKTITFPLASPTQWEQQAHEKFVAKYGCDPFDIERLVEVFFPRV